jgi:hypothetical protein
MGFMGGFFMGILWVSIFFRKDQKANLNIKKSSIKKIKL